jgi:NADH-quinone oxidoreductase subunit E
MQRFDLRHLKDNFYDEMIKKIENETKEGEVSIFLFEIGDFSPVQKSADLVKERGHELMNSLKFNEVDWTITVKRKKD